MAGVASVAGVDWFIALFLVSHLSDRPLGNYKSLSSETIAALQSITILSQVEGNKLFKTLQPILPFQKNSEETKTSRLDGFR